MTEFDGTWVVTHGAHMAWRYARSVQPALADMRAALDAGNWALCVESCALALRAIVFCHHVGEGVSGSPTEVELQLLLALDERPAAVALRDLPWSVHANETDARAAVDAVERHDEELRAALPFDMPVIRTAGGYGPTVRVTATVGKWRADRGMGPVSWNREGL
ncbi:hypothetical protein SK803_26685 [Lentzea sp. BCCO 10_0856]|uniref:Uncharacterized protein n=1 Tax=Lentzea miocenica TaxID=3095431 RepID=A0ABU4T6P0_9PSEU|nr:hypothetical protein [Lentzea sp. BCCO 10_0856]MDX8033824.1 hypothetical protein [Lentzea sp. BCCO 10_0856]